MFALSLFIRIFLSCSCSFSIYFTDAVSGHALNSLLVSDLLWFRAKCDFIFRFSKKGRLRWNKKPLKPSTWNMLRSFVLRILPCHSIWYTKKHCFVGVKTLHTTINKFAGIANIKPVAQHNRSWAFSLFKRFMYFLAGNLFDWC